MNKVLSLKEQIYRFASSTKWENGAVFERLAMERGFKSSNAGRRCRDLVTAKRFERKIIDGTVWYRRTALPAFKKTEQAKLL